MAESFYVAPTFGRTGVHPDVIMRELEYFWSPAAIVLRFLQRNGSDWAVSADVFDVYDSMVETTTVGMSRIQKILRHLVDRGILDRRKLHTHRHGSSTNSTYAYRYSRLGHAFDIYRHEIAQDRRKRRPSRGKR